ncbi:MAG: MerR family transcriptional regulator [Lachnospiraceae bacterium]|nr:MerR family transcriptional regulator [Lachnospiraceae bacterium]
MKIGEFAKKHEVTVDTVRHYISEGLLTPLRKNTQYDFSEIDNQVMDTILLLKSMNFKLEEMRGYLLVQSMYSGNVLAYLGSFRKIFEEKLNENKRIIRELQIMNERIEKHLEAYKVKEISRGVPLSMLPDLVCPDCGKVLTLDDAVISHNEVMEGKLVCLDCGRTYYIRYGMMMDEIMEMPQVSEEVVGALEGYLEQNDENYIINIRHLYQKTAEIAEENAAQAHNILIDGGSITIINSAVFMRTPPEAKLFIRSNENMIPVKMYMEEMIPKNTLFYMGDIENAPFQVPMDYGFLEDYDVDVFQKGCFRTYKQFAPGAKISCFKVLVPEKSEKLADEEKFLRDMKALGFQKKDEYRTGKILIKKESVDMDILKKEKDMEMEYVIFNMEKV